MKPKVSIVIPVYNGSNYLNEAIDSAIMQTYKNIEIIVINDGSDDKGKTREVALSYGDKIRYYEKENGGTSSALNYGIQRMEGDYFAWLSHDDVYLPERIEKHMDVIEKSGNPETLVHSAFWNWIDSKGLYDPVCSYQYPSQFYEHSVLSLLLGLVDGLSLTIHRSYFDQCGLFDINLRTTQDYQKWFEIFQMKKPVYINEHLVKCRVHGEQQGRRLSNLWIKESDELFQRLIDQIDDISFTGAGYDEYTVLGIVYLRMMSVECFGAADAIISKMKKLREPQNAEAKRCELASLFNKNEKGIYLYCMGNRGKALLDAMYLRNIQISGFSDRDESKRAVSVHNIEAVMPDDIPKDSILIVTKERPEKLVEDFKSKGYLEVRSYEEIVRMIMNVPIDKCLIGTL